MRVHMGTYARAERERERELFLVHHRLSDEINANIGFRVEGDIWSTL